MTTMPNTKKAALIRSHYHKAISQVYKIYHDSEEIAAYLVPEVFRLENGKCESDVEEQERLERLAEKTGVRSRTKEAMHFVHSRLHELARDRTDSFPTSTPVPRSLIWSLDSEI